MTNEMLEIEVAYVKPGDQILRALQGKPGITVEQAIKDSGITEDCPEIDLGKNKVGIFGKAAKLDAELRPGDRVEIYRPLIADPKEARKKRAEQGKTLKKGGS
jgi:putative ubiquitin-RnfH superfamily antitoxin RatB of RatAB toxin-antitoxin module